MSKIPVRRVAQVLLVLALFFVIVNPELRVLVLLVDAIGLELVFLLLSLQLRSTAILLAPIKHTLKAHACSTAFRAGSLALRAYQPALVFRRFDRLICPVLIFMSYGLRCRRATIGDPHGMATSGP